MKRVTVGGLTAARSAKRATLSSPAMGYDASRTRASLRSAGLRSDWRWRTSSPIRVSVSFVRSRAISLCSGPLLTRILEAVSVAAIAARAARLRVSARGGWCMSVAAHDSDVETLHRMGYAQELLRRMGTFSNFGVS